MEATYPDDSETQAQQLQIPRQPQLQQGQDEQHRVLEQILEPVKRMRVKIEKHIYAH